jgi:GNAT superfamily N-acetyltransferase
MDAAAIREAGIGEEAELLPAYEWLFASPGSRPPSWDAERALAALAEAIASPGAAVLVAEDDDGLAGICTAYIDLNSVRYGPRCWVEDLAVRPEARSRGTGGALLDAASDWARELGASHLELDTGLARTDAQRFYDRRGPAAVGYTYSWPL